jgi:hypothetical protein
MHRRTAIGLAVVVAAGVAVLGLLVGNPLATGGDAGAEGVEAFESPEAFESYVEESRESRTGRSRFPSRASVPTPDRD